MVDEDVVVLYFIDYVKDMMVIMDGFLVVFVFDWNLFDNWNIFYYFCEIKIIYDLISDY